MDDTKKQRDSVVFYRSFYESIKELEPVQQAEVYNAVFEFGLNGTEPEMSGISKAIFTLIKPQIVANNARYFNGQRGGRPRKDDDETGQKDDENSDETDRETESSQNQTETKQEPSRNLDLTKHKPKITKTKPKQNQTETKQEPNENVNVNDNDIRTEVEDISCSTTRARVHKHIFETLKGEWFLKQWTDSDRSEENVPVFEELVQILESADTDKKVESVLLLDVPKFYAIFNTLKRSEDEIEDAYRYVWKSVFDHANHVKSKRNGLRGIG